MEDDVTGLTMFLSLAYCVLFFFFFMHIRFNPLPVFLCSAAKHLLYGKNNISPPIILMFTIITSFILKLLFLQIPLSWSAVRVPNCIRPDRQLTTPTVTDLKFSCTHRRPLHCQLLAVEKGQPGNPQLSEKQHCLPEHDLWKSKKG